MLCSQDSFLGWKCLESPTTVQSIMIADSGDGIPAGSRYICLEKFRNMRKITENVQCWLSNKQISSASDSQSALSFQNPASINRPELKK